MFNGKFGGGVKISIHAPREGSDNFPTVSFPNPFEFLSTLPARGATGCKDRIKPRGLFLSTLPARGATRNVEQRFLPEQHFYPRSPRGERHPLDYYNQGKRYISIHAPREGSDFCRFVIFQVWNVFLSTLPARGATSNFFRRMRMGSYFYPRSPRGERQRYANGDTSVMRFLSTLPARGATSRRRKNCKASKIHFYPRSPRGERRAYDGLRPRKGLISIHAPREGSDTRPAGVPELLQDFYPRSPRGERQNARLFHQLPSYFYPRSPRGERRLCTHLERVVPGYFYPRSPRGERQQMC